MTYCFLLKHYRGVTIEKCRAGKPTATRSALLYGDAAGAAEKTARKASIYIFIYIYIYIYTLYISHVQPADPPVISHESSGQK